MAEPVATVKDKPTIEEATIPGTQVALTILGVILFAAAWPLIPTWMWITAAVILLAAAGWWLLRARARTRNRRGGRKDRGGRQTAGMAGLARRLGLGRNGGRKATAGAGPGRGAGKNTASGRKSAAAKAQRAAGKAATRAAKKHAAAQRSAARKAAKTQRSAAKKNGRNGGRRGPMQKTGPNPAVDIWNRKDKTKKTKPARPTPRPGTPNPNPKAPTPRRHDTMSDHTPPGVAARLMNDHASALQRFFASYNPATLVNISDDLKTMPDGLRENAKAFGTLADRFGQFKTNATVAGHLKIAETVLGRVADQIDAAHAAFERSESEALNRQRNGDQHDRRGDISRHQGGA